MKHVKEELIHPIKITSFNSQKGSKKINKLWEK